MYSNLAFWLYGINIFNGTFIVLNVFLGGIVLGRFFITVFYSLYETDIKKVYKWKKKTFHAFILFCVSLVGLVIIPSQKDMFLILSTKNIDNYIMHNPESALLPQKILHNMDNVSKFVSSILEEMKSWF